MIAHNSQGLLKINLLFENQKVEIGKESKTKRLRMDK